MKTMRIGLFAVLVMMAGSAMADYSIGDSVECNWKGRGKFYSGRIMSKEGARLFIHYNDGDKEHTTSSMCRPAGGGGGVPAGGMMEGSAVSCRWKNGNTWYPGVIVRKTGHNVFIHYSDGDKEHTTLSKCRPR
jgi:hypothetical protein